MAASILNPFTKRSVKVKSLNELTAKEKLSPLTANLISKYWLSPESLQTRCWEGRPGAGARASLPLTESQSSPSLSFPLPSEPSADSGLRGPGSRC